MQQELFIAIVAGLGGMLGWGLADFLAKKTIDVVGDIVTLAWAGMFGTIAFFIGALFLALTGGRTLSAPHDGTTWALLIFFGILQAVVYLFVYRGFSKGQVGLLSPVFASFSGIVALISIAFLGEGATGIKIISLVIIFGGIFLLNVDMMALRAKHLSITQIPGLAEVAIATVLASIWTILWDRFVNGHDWSSYALWMFVFMTLGLFAYAWLRRLPLKVSSTTVWIFLALIGVCETVAYFSISLGYGATSLTSVVALLSGGFSLPTILLARIFLKEKSTSLQTFGSILIVVGIMLLGVI